MNPWRLSDIKRAVCASSSSGQVKLEGTPQKNSGVFGDGVNKERYMELGFRFAHALELQHFENQLIAA